MAGEPYAPPWIYDRLGEASPADGKKSLNQFLSDNGHVTTNPTKTTTSVFNKGSQKEHK